MNKRYSFLLAHVFLFGLSICALADTNLPIEAMDSFGRTIVLPRAPERIACLYAFSGHVVTMLDRGQDVVAIVKGLKKDVLLHQLIPDIKQIPVPANGGIINIEALLNTAPDIVFLKPETAAITAEIKKLDRFHLPYFVAGYQSMAQQMVTIEMIGKVIGRYDRALAYTRYYKDMIQRVRSRTRLIPRDKKVRVYHSVNEACRTDAPGSIEADWTLAAGIINVSVGKALHAKGDKSFADIEQILLWNPDVIIVNEEGVDKEILTNKKWSPIKAVRDKKVFPIPVGISRWGHPGGLETPLAILWTAKTVYPDQFRDIDLEKEITVFYHSFFNLRVDKKMMSQILGNRGMRQAVK